MTERVRGGGDLVRREELREIIGGARGRKEGKESGAEQKTRPGAKGKKRKREERWTCPLTVDSLRRHSPPCPPSAVPARERPSNGPGTAGNAPGRLDGRGYQVNKYSLLT